MIYIDRNKNGLVSKSLPMREVSDEWAEQSGLPCATMIVRIAGPKPHELLRQ